MTPAIMQGGNELILAPVSDTGLAIGRDIWRNQRSKRRLQRQPAGKRLSAGGRMTCRAIAGHREVASTFDAVKILVVRKSRARDRGGKHDCCKGRAHRSSFQPSGPGFLR